jgi:YVTN family beta-propeller protein
VDATASRAFVSNNGGDVFVVDLTANTLVQAIAGPASTRSLLVDGNLLYVLDAFAESVWVFNLDNLPTPSSTPEETDDSYFLMTTIPVGNNPMGMALDAIHSRLYVANMDDDTVSVVDTVSQQEITRISIDEDDISSDFLRDGESPIALALGDFNTVTYLFVAGFTSNSIVVINTESLGVVEVYPNTEAEELNL